MSTVLVPEMIANGGNCLDFNEGRMNDKYEQHELCAMGRVETEEGSRERRREMGDKHQLRDQKPFAWAGVEGSTFNRLGDDA